MSLTVKAISRHARFGQLAVAGAALAAVALVGGCTVHVHEHEGEYQPPPPREVVVEPQPQPAPAVEVVYQPAPVEVVAVYEPELSPYGHWVSIGAYGRCWVYGNRHDGWRPYMNGHWVATEQGWLWVSEGEEASWGATCYHYGRWYEDAGEGWVWVPGRVWGPSWCAWRAGGGYSAWAPLPPECGDGFAINAVVVDRYVPRERFVSCRTEFIGEVNIHEHIEVKNITIIEKTTNITNITIVNGRARNVGVPFKNVEAASGRHVVVERTKTVRDPEEARREVALGHPVVYSPLAVESYAKSHPVTRHEATGRETDTHRPLSPTGYTAEELRLKKEQEDKDRLAQEHNAKTQTEEERLAKEKADKEKAALNHENREKTAEEKTAEERENKNLTTEEKVAKEKAAQEKIAEEKTAKEKLAQEKEAEKADKEKAAKEKLDEEKAMKEKAIQDKEAEKADKEKALKEKAEQEKALKEKAAEEKKQTAEEKAAAEKAAKDKKDQGAGHVNKPDNSNPNDPNNPNKKKKPNENGQDPNAPTR